MKRNFANARLILAAIILCGACGVPAVAHAQTRWYLSAAGSDTLSLERLTRSEDTIAGVWITYHNGADRHREILRHEYAISLAPNRRPLAVHLVLRHPAGPAEYTFDSRYADDSVVVSISHDTIARDTVQHRAVAARHAYPALGSSIAMFEIVIAAARRDSRGSGSVDVATLPLTGPFIPRTISVELLSAGAARFGPTGGPVLFTDAAGALDSIVAANGQVPLRRVAPFDIDAVALSASRSGERTSGQAVAGSSRATSSTARDARFAGEWNGVLDAGAVKLRLAVTLR